MPGETEMLYLELLPAYLLLEAKNVHSTWLD